MKYQATCLVVALLVLACAGAIKNQEIGGTPTLPPTDQGGTLVIPADTDQDTGVDTKPPPVVQGTRWVRFREASGAPGYSGAVIFLLDRPGLVTVDLIFEDGSTATREQVTTTRVAVFFLHSIKWTKQEAQPEWVKASTVTVQEAP